ncbi:gamma-glutamyl-gamma-aminobutyrate hydrolase family protein [Microbacterium oxydans]|jgi:putative glutamine amidotransferase|uniref:gamma-glutamyl-gamma-aminobutyrate hydrolase family protein n=1 Tax=Microbacterium oxydans TaxID=82380 RepID=UPI00226B49BB|nr:gamma-glutamyl-gamma-aminobutyrate hydrolase family protein [Microbacterium oxydans]WAA65423.1 gamma-glutamyl-gamma-aminobutyrate hydrolase family protein [Microbacterium oxydans]
MDIISTPAPTRPLIGISGRRLRAAAMGAPHGFADAPLEAYLSEYATSVLGAGGLPVHLPMDAAPAELVERLDGVVIVGGDDVDPRRYGQAPGPFTALVDPQRDEFESGLIQAAIDGGVPLLGVCRGAQLLNVVRGGTLHQHLAHGEGESHGSYAYPRAHRVHEVRIAPGSVTHALYGETTRVNSFHHQAVDVPGRGIVVTGWAPDGVVEAIELEGLPVVGVQWHPETFDADPIFGWLVAQAAARATLSAAPETQNVA